MRALGIEWRVGMVDVDGDVARVDELGDMMMNGCPVEWEQNFRPLSADDSPDLHHPSNLGHLLEMVCEVYGCAEVWVSRDCEPFAGSDFEDGEYIPTERVRWTAELCYDGDFVCPIGFGKSAPLALLDALDRKAREVADG